MADPFKLSVTDYKAAFVDSRAITAHVDAVAHKELSRKGAFVRQAMKSSIRYASKTSSPGNPPRAIRTNRFQRTTTNRKTGAVTKRATSPLRELIFFAQDRNGDVIVGPAKFGKRPGVVPPTLERGGPAVISEPIPRPKFRKATARQSESFRRLVKEGRIIVPPRQYKLKTIRIAPRPFLEGAGRKGISDSNKKAGR